MAPPQITNSAKPAATRCAYSDQCRHYPDALLVKRGTDQWDNCFHHTFQIDLETRLSVGEEVTLTKKS